MTAPCTHLTRLDVLDGLTCPVCPERPEVEYEPSRTVKMIGIVVLTVALLIITFVLPADPPLPNDPGPRPAVSTSP